MAVPKPKLDKTLLKHAAIAAWAQAVHTAIDRACQTTEAFDPTQEGGRQFKEVIKLVAALIEKLNDLSGPFAPPPKPAAGTAPKTITINTPSGAVPLFLASGDGCDGTDDCPDGQICVDGTCESPYPQYQYYDRQQRRPGSAER